jgi:hypothetical protein
MKPVEEENMRRMARAARALGACAFIVLGASPETHAYKPGYPKPKPHCTSKTHCVLVPDCSRHQHPCPQRKICKTQKVCDSS